MTLQGKPASAAGPLLPRAQDPEPELRGFRFVATPLPHEAGVHALTRRIGDLLYPALIAEASDMAAEAAAFAAREAAAMAVIDGQLWMGRSQARQRLQIVRSQRSSI
jgi:hypothetical protein